MYIILILNLYRFKDDIPEVVWKNAYNIILCETTNLMFAKEINVNSGFGQELHQYWTINFKLQGASI